VQTADVEEARKLKQIHVNAALLKEQLMSEKAHANRAEASLAEIADIQVRLKELELELQAWRDMVGQIPGVEGRDDVLRKLRELQREVMSAMAKTGEVTAQVKELQTALEKTEGERQKAVAHGVALQEETTEAMLKIKRLESKVAYLISWFVS
jgi:chromosome segregation ATPase